jgi:hypothetical protein
VAGEFSTSDFVIRMSSRAGIYRFVVWSVPTRPCLQAAEWIMASRHFEVRLQRRKCVYTAILLVFFVLTSTAVADAASNIALPVHHRLLQQIQLVEFFQFMAQ